MSSLQQQIEDRGLQIFDLVDQNPESIFSKAGFYQRMMAFSMRDEHFKVQMFRFVDVLASLRHSTDIVQHLSEYFADMRNGSVPFLQTGIKAARVVPWLTAPILRWHVVAVLPAPAEPPAASRCWERLAPIRGSPPSFHFTPSSSPRAPPGSHCA